jgi:hypothetical protein
MPEKREMFIGVISYNTILLLRLLPFRRESLIPLKI